MRGRKTTTPRGCCYEEKKVKGLLNVCIPRPPVRLPPPPEGPAVGSLGPAVSFAIRQAGADRPDGCSSSSPRTRPSRVLYLWLFRPSPSLRPHSSRCRAPLPFPPLRQIDGRAALRVPARPVLGVHLAHQPPRVHVALLWERVLPPKNQLDVLLEIKRVEGRLEALRKRMKRRPRRRVRQGSFHIPHARVCGD